MVVRDRAGRRRSSGLDVFAAKSRAVIGQVDVASAAYLINAGLINAGWLVPNGNRRFQAGRQDLAHSGRRKLADSRPALYGAI